MAIGPQAKWIKNKFENIKSFVIFILGAVIINFLIVYFFKSYSIISNLIIISSLFLIISSFLIFLKKSKNKFSKNYFSFIIWFFNIFYWAKS